MPRELSLQTTAKQTEFYEFECGCWFHRESIGDQTLVLKMQVCELCMATQYTNLEALDKSNQLTLGLASATGAADPDQQ